VPLAGKNGEVVKQAYRGVKLIPVDWNQVMEKKAAWTTRWKNRRDRQLGQAGRRRQAEVLSIRLP